MEQKVRLRIKKFDILIFAIALGITTLSFFPLINRRKSTAVLVITSGSDEYRYPLSADKTIEIDGAIGKSTIQIQGGFAFFADSDCPNKICVQSGKISQDGQWAACLPNDVFLRIEGGNSDKIDGLSY